MLIARLALHLNFADPSRITDEDLRLYTAEAARPGAIAALVVQQHQVMPTREQVAA